MRDSSGKAFIVQLDPADISTPTASAEFAGIASNTIPEDDSFAASIETIEYKGWLVFEEEPQTTIDWNTHTKPSDVAALLEISQSSKQIVPQFLLKTTPSMSTQV